MPRVGDRLSSLAQYGRAAPRFRGSRGPPEARTNVLYGCLRRDTGRSRKVDEVPVPSRYLALHLPSKGHAAAGGIDTRSMEDRPIPRDSELDPEPPPGTDGRYPNADGNSDQIREPIGKPEPSACAFQPTSLYAMDSVQGLCQEPVTGVQRRSTRYFAGLDQDRGSGRLVVLNLEKEV